MITMKLLEIFPPSNTVQQVSQLFIDFGESGRWLYYSFTAGLFFFLIFLTYYSNLAKRYQAPWGALTNKVFLSDYTFCAIIIAFILLSRIPMAVLGIQNPDEPLWVASAKTFAHDPRPYISVDTGTGGPIVPFALLALKIVGLSIDEGSIKFMSGAMMALSAGFIFLALSLTNGSTISRIAVLPLIVAVSMVKTADLIAYNSEHPVILFLSIALFFLARLYVFGAGKFSINIIFIGLSLGLIPFTKLQGVLIAFYIGFSACVLLITRKSYKQLFYLLISAIMPTLIFLQVIWVTGAFEDFWLSYILANFSYATHPFVSGFTSVLLALIDLVYRPQEFPLFLYCIFIHLFIGLLLVLLQIRRMSRENVAMFVFSTILLLISAYCVMAPGRLFIHYILFLVTPLCIEAAIVLDIGFKLASKDSIRSHYSHLIYAVLVAISLYYFTSSFTYHPEYLTDANRHYGRYSPQGEVVAILDHYLSPDSKRLAVWEYEPELFEGSDFILGTRFPATSIHGGSLESYFVETYIKDLKKNTPTLFVESFYRTPNTFENFPELKTYIHENYVLEAEIGGNNIFVRKDRLPVKKPWVVKRKKLKVTIPEFHGNLTELKRNGSFMQFTGWAIVGDNLSDQHAMLAIVSKQDTILVDSYQTMNRDLAESIGHKEYLLNGFVGFLPLREIPKGDHKIAIWVENRSKVGFKQLNRILNRDSL